MIKDILSKEMDRVSNKLEARRRELAKAHGIVLGENALNDLFNERLAQLEYHDYEAKLLSDAQLKLQHMIQAADELQDVLGMIAGHDANKEAGIA